MCFLFSKIVCFVCVFIVGGVIIVFFGCGIIYKIMGDVLVSFGQVEFVFYLFVYDDVCMGCIIGEV